MPSNTFIVLNYSFIAPMSNYFFQNFSNKSRFYKKFDDDKFILRTMFDEFIFPVNVTFTSQLFVSVPSSIVFKNCFVGSVHLQAIKVIFLILNLFI